LCRRDVARSGRTLEPPCFTSRSPKEPAVFALVLIAVAIAVAVVARLVTVVRTDRPLAAPRSHTHEVDPRSARLYRVV
jgi:hypothetical protein